MEILAVFKIVDVIDHLIWIKTIPTIKRNIFQELKMHVLIFDNSFLFNFCCVCQQNNTSKLNFWKHLQTIRPKGESQNGCFKKTKQRQIFRQTSISYPLIQTCLCACRGVKDVFFRKIWRALFSWHAHFEIHPFVLSPTNLHEIFYPF